MPNTDQWHYTDQTGKQIGPTNTDDLIQLILSKTIPTSAMAWKDGMAGWKPVSQIEALQVAPSNPGATPEMAVAPQGKPSSAKVDPYITPESAKSTQLEPPPEIPLSYDELHGKRYSFDGIGRLSYILWRPLLYLLLFIPLTALSYFLEPSISWMVLTGVTAIFIFLMIRLHCLRFKNIGISPWWTVALLIPIINLPLYLMLNICPAGYAETRKLDLPGKILAFFVIGIPVLFIVLSILFDVSSAYVNAANKAKETIDEQKSKYKKEQVQPPAQ